MSVLDRPNSLASAFQSIPMCLESSLMKASRSIRPKRGVQELQTEDVCFYIYAY